MADMDSIRRLVQGVHEREFGDDEARMARFRQDLATFLGPDVFKLFNFAFDWSTGGSRGHAPMATSNLASATLWLYEGTDGHAFDLSLMHEVPGVLSAPSRDHIDSADEFLKKLKDWV